MARISKSVRAGRTAKLVYLEPDVADALAVHAIDTKQAPSDVVQALLRDHLPNARIRRAAPSKSSRATQTA